MAIAFFALAAYVTIGSVRGLLGSGEPDPSPVGSFIFLTALGHEETLALVEELRRRWLDGSRRCHHSRSRAPNARSIR